MSPHGLTDVGCRKLIVCLNREQCAESSEMDDASPSGVGQSDGWVAGLSKIRTCLSNG